MKHPLWIVNSLLLVLILLVLVFIWLTRERIPRRTPIEPKDYRAVIIEIPKVNIAKIYQHDLFDTYRELPPPLPPAQLEPPKPPVQQPVSVPPKTKPNFLDPLSIMLKGVVIVSQDDTKNMATIADTKTDQEVVYKMGDKIEDAQLIRIFKNKVIFVRSNGQQEILYLREKDAKSDPVYAFIGEWEHIIEKISDKEFSVDQHLFVERVHNLAQFIDIMDLTTAYKKGKSIGCRIGAIAKNSLGDALGLQTGDIILSINGIPVTGTAQRFEVYKALVGAKLEDVIKVMIQRTGKNIEIQYKLEEHKSAVSMDPDAIVSSKAAAPEELQKKEINNMKERYQFAPTVEQIKNRERENMLRRGKRPKQSIAE